MNNSTISRIGTILYAIVMGFFGVNHFLHAADMAGMVPSYMPGGGTLWVYISGAALVLAAIAFLIGKYVKLAGLLLALFLIILILVLHLPKAGTDQVAMTMLLKDTGLAAAALIIAGRGN